MELIQLCRRVLEWAKFSGERVRKRIGRIWTLLGLIGSALATACAGTGFATEFIEIGDEESGLQFYGPGLAGGYRRFPTGNNDRLVRRTLATCGPQAGEFPFARNYYSEAPPDRHVARTLPVEVTVGRWGWFNHRMIEIGMTATAANAIGRIECVTAAADGVAFVVWLQTFGAKDGTGVGRRLLNGYYGRCRRPMMSTADAESIVKLVGDRGHGTVPAPAGWSAIVVAPSLSGPA